MLVKKPPRRKSARTEGNIINAGCGPRMEGQPNGARNVTCVTSIHDRIEQANPSAEGATSQHNASQRTPAMSNGGSYFGPLANFEEEGVGEDVVKT